MKRLTKLLFIFMLAFLCVQFGIQNANAHNHDTSSVTSDVYERIDDESFHFPMDIFNVNVMEGDGFLTFKYDDFSENLDRLILNNAMLHNSDEIMLTDSKTNQWGSVFNEEKVSLKDERSFSTYFSFIFSDIVGTWSPYTGGDGLVFTVQTFSNGAGSGGGSLGYSGIAPSIGIEFDTFPNNEHGDDGSNHHIAINKNGVTTSPLAIREIDKGSITNLHDDGKEHHAWIDYDGPNGVLEVRLSDNVTRPVAPLLRLELDSDDRLTNILDADLVYVGFTAATGGNYQKHRITSWYFTNKFAPIDIENNTYKQAPAGYDLDHKVLDDGTVELTITALDGDKADVPLTIASTNGAIVTPSETTTDSSGVATVILSSPNGSEITTTITVQDPGGVFPTEVITIPGRSAPPLPENIVANATRDQVTVKEVPVDTAVKVYNDNGDLLGAGQYTVENQGTVEIATSPYDLAAGEEIFVTFTEKDRIESVKVQSIALAESRS